jgi:hypothetical protein
MKQRKSFDFAAIGRSIDENLAVSRAFDPAASDLVRRAAVQVSYADGELPLNEQEGEYLAANEQTAEGGRKQLRDDVRNTILKAMLADGTLMETYDSFGRAWETTLVPQRVLGQVLRKEDVNLRQLTVAELNALFRIRFWVDGMGFELPDGATIRGALNRWAMVVRFERQTANFRGRMSELRVLDNYVFSVSKDGEDMMNRPPLLVYGVGGIGKSTLISRFILRKALADEAAILPFVYLDFDHPGLSISDPLSLFAAGLRQLITQFPAARGVYAPLENALGDLLATQSLRTDDSEAQEQSSFGSKVAQKTSARSWDRILGDLGERYLSQAQYDGLEATQPVLIVLDSFEEAQYRTGETEIRSFLEFLNSVTSWLPNLRLLIVGRSDLVVSPFTFRKLAIGDFDEAAAVAYLKGVGVTDKVLRQLIYEQAGGNPLTLKLAAALAEKEEVGKKITVAGFKQLLAGTQVQELLVRRNIEHIRNPEVRRLALPGMLLRRIDADVIQYVLAPVCGLGEIDHTKADVFYEGLRRVTFLVEQRGGELYFRRDLRTALRKEIWRKERERCITLHRRMAAYYKDMVEPISQAEHYYHLFQLDGKVWSAADQVDWKTLRPFLEDALLELPPQPAAYLARKFGVRLPSEIMRQAGREENDFAMVRRMEEIVVNGVGGLTQMQEVWQEVAERTDSNEVFFIYYRQLLALRLGYFDRMLEDLSPRSRAKLEELWVYLNLLRNNYQKDYLNGLTEVTGVFTISPPQQLLETIVLCLKCLALTGKPFNEELVLSFSMSAGDIKNDATTEEDARLLNWRPFTLRLWGVRRTFRPLEREQFTGLCRAIYQSFAKVGGSYTNLADELRDADPKRFGLVLQNETGKLVEDIAPFGVPEVVARDYLDFLIEFYDGEYEKITAFVDRARGGVTAESSASASFPAPTTTSPKPTYWDKIKDVFWSASSKTKNPVKSVIEEQRRKVVWQAKGFLKEDKPELAISQLSEWARLHNQERYINQLAILTAQINHRNDDQIQGSVTYEEINISRNRIIDQVLSVINEIEQV